MSKRRKGIMLLMALLLAGWNMAGQDVRTIKLNEDRDQKYKGSKVYELKNVRCDDITPFILGAVKRYNPQGDVQRLNYKPNGKQYIVVSTGVDMIPYIDDMVAKLDKPCTTKDKNGSIIDGDGIYRFTYKPTYRASENMNVAIQDLRSDGTMYFDAPTNLFYWKDSKSDGETLMTWLKAIDRPAPQMQLTLNVYNINENDFMELGIDYVAWKNGPGATLFGTGFNFMHFASGENVSSLSNPLNISDFGPLTSSLGGFMVAPQFDATFLRMLAQNGKAKVSTSSSITLVNDYTTPDPGNDNFAGAKYKIRFTPNFQNIYKDANMNASVDQSTLDFYFYVRKPVISFTEDVITKHDSEKDKDAKAAQLSFGWVMRVEDMVQQTTNNGQPVINQQNFRAWLTLAQDTEKVIGVYTKDHKVNQNISMPFLGDIPGLKYLFGTSVDSKTQTKVFVTVTAAPINTGTDLPQWAGRIVSTSELANNREGIGKDKTQASAEIKKN